jgi:hypothetical protein
MATRTCPDCGLDISVWAKACPQCGRPTPGSGPITQLVAYLFGPILFLLALGAVLVWIGYGR